MFAKTRAIALITTLSLCTMAFASVAAEKTSPFPFGSYQNENNIVIFKPDGTFVGTTPDGKDWVKGTYTHKGGEFTVVDSWEGAEITEGGEHCTGKPGHYRWVKEGKVLTAHVIDDACAGRKQGTDGVAWTQIR